MPQVSGQPAQYVGQQAADKRRLLIVQALWGIGLIAAIAGFLLGSTLHRITMPPLATFIGSTACLGLSWLLSKEAIHCIDKTHRDRLKMESGAFGETVVAHQLSKLPSEYHVLNDIDAGYGNLDHVVVGPTGVFVIDAKNWRGIISAAPDSTILLNGNPVSPSNTAKFITRIMGVKKNLNLPERLDVQFFQPVLAFTSAHVNAKWGATGKIHCVLDYKLIDYILGRKHQPLSQSDIDTIYKAFRSLQSLSNGSRGRPTEIAANSPNIEHQPSNADISL
jgi:hypothetical protein